ncbi:hypothetical protein C5167_041390 [Papaver somniferum]|nr:hypothetical protein C5167_041390 [Papaver somniferum]
MWWESAAHIGETGPSMRLSILQLVLPLSLPEHMLKVFRNGLIFRNATISILPQHWQPNKGLLMANDISGVNLEEAYHNSNSRFQCCKACSNTTATSSFDFQMNMGYLISLQEMLQVKT